MIASKAELVARHRELAAWHLARSRRVSLDVLHELHARFAGELAAEADGIEASTTITDAEVFAISEAAKL